LGVTEGTRALQAETGGFTEFVPLPFVHMAAHVPLEQRTTLYGRTHIEPVPVPG
jgi:2-iminoacetate synthase ThiH